MKLPLLGNQTRFLDYVVIYFSLNQLRAELYFVLKVYTTYTFMKRIQSVAGIES